MDLHTAQAQQHTGSGWKSALMVVLIAVGLVLGAFLGLVGALFFGLIPLEC
jgi:hypothetical protein